MDVSLSGTRVFWLFVCTLSLIFVSCGNRYDLSTERGRRARIDDANFHLSKGECGAAAEAIDPLYYSSHVNDEIRIVKASAFACGAHYNVLTFISNFASSSNSFKAVAKSLDSVVGDGARQALYNAVDVMTQSSAAMNSTSRTQNENAFMVFLQFGVISSILRNYGAPTSDGSKGQNLVYETAAVDPVGEVSNADACALAAAYSHISNSYPLSGLSDNTTLATVNSLNAICVGFGQPSCATVNRVRSACNGTNAESIVAEQAIGGVNSSW